MNKLSITYEHRMTSMKKKGKPKNLPQSIPSTQPYSLVLVQSNITLFQSSPVVRANSSTKEE